jgi:hypothetical protein
MATRIETRTATPYREDSYAWALEQAELLRQRRFAELDLDNLIEEVEGLALAQRSAVLTNARIVLEHLLKLQHSPARDPRNGWRASVREHRRRIEVEITPALLRSLAEELPRLYRMARADAIAAMRDHGEDAAADALPEECPFTLDQVTGDWMS